MSELLGYFTVIAGMIMLNTGVFPGTATFLIVIGCHWIYNGEGR